MMLWIRNAILLSVVASAATACGMMDEKSSSAMNGKNNWFEYAYYSSPATFERDSEDLLRSKPLKLQ